MWPTYGYALAGGAGTSVGLEINDYPSDGTDDKVDFILGSIVYFGSAVAGGITSNTNVTAVSVLCEIFNLSDVKQGADLLNVSADLVATVEKTFYVMNGSALLSRSGLAVGEYYMKTTVSGGTPTLMTEVSRAYFSVITVMPRARMPLSLKVAPRKLKLVVRRE